MSKNKNLSVGDLERIAERVLKFSEADETEVDVDATTDALTRFANNTIHQNVAEANSRNFRARCCRWPHRPRHHE